MWEGSSSSRFRLRSSARTAWRPSTVRTIPTYLAFTYAHIDTFVVPAAEKCTHKLAEMPRWLSSQKMEVVKSLLSVRLAIPSRRPEAPSDTCCLCTQDDPAMLLRESMGVGADSNTKAFPSKDVDAFLGRERVAVPVDIMSALSRNNTRHFVLAVDPSGGGSSAFGVCSMIQLPTGQIVVRTTPPAASCPAAPPPTSHSTHTPAPQTCPGPGTSCARSAEG